MFNRFTERARKVIILAKEEARRFNHDYIGTEHILLGLIREGEGVAVFFPVAAPHPGPTPLTWLTQPGRSTTLHSTAGACPGN